MKRAITLSIGAMALAATALPSAAADLGARPITKAPVAAPIAAYNWSGCYIGANGGGEWSHLTGTVTAGVFPGAVVAPLPFPVGAGGVFVNNNNNSSSGMFGGQIGCQWQTGAWVWGVEGDIDATNAHRTFVAPGGLPFFFPGDVIDFRRRWDASVRGRVGYAWDRFLVYATGGVAFTDVRARFLPVFTPFVFENDRTVTGGTIGAGIEYGITDNISLGVEYRYTQFGHDNATFGTALAPLAFGVPVVANVKLNDNQVTARLNWRVNWFGGPVASRY
jgi:outer membrane immunogenic protein